MGFIVAILGVLAVLFVVFLIAAMAMGVILLTALSMVAGFTGYAIAMAITHDPTFGIAGAGIAIFLVFAVLGFMGSGDQTKSRTKT